MQATVTAEAGAPRSADKRSQRLHPVARFVVKRLALGAVTLLVVSLLIFALTAVVPGDAVTVVLGKSGTPETIAALQAELGLDEPLWTQYLSWLGGLLHGDLGVSVVAMINQQPDPSIASAIADPLTNSLILGLITALLLVPLTLLLGALAGLFADRFLDHTISVPTLVLGGLPEFVTGALFIYIFFTQLHVLPPVSLVPPGDSPLQTPQVLVLPVLTLLVVAVGSGARQTRLGMIDALRSDFVLAATLNGIARGRVVAWYAMRNAVANAVQTIAQNLQYLVGGIIVVESVFAYPGIGVYLVNAVQSRDTNAILAASMILAVLYTIINIAADLLVVFLVPRLRSELV